MNISLKFEVFFKNTHVLPKTSHETPNLQVVYMQQSPSMDVRKCVWDCFITKITKWNLKKAEIPDYMQQMEIQTRTEILI